MGLVNAVDRDWFGKAMELAQVVARRPPLAVRLGKEAVLTAEAVDLTHERRLFEIAMATEDRVEGMRAFIEKRKPDFRGR
jgi:enoyl-CoA hydratase/carnithine racemase